MRYWLRHETPDGIEHPDFFITLCCRHRALNHLCRPERADSIIKTIQHFHETKRWFCSIALLMPDHLHAIVQIPDHRKFSTVIGEFKQRTNQATGIIWQRGFFDHRIRHHSSLEEKWKYIEMNPVRAGYVSAPEDWPYRWMHTRTESFSFNPVHR